MWAKVVCATLVSVASAVGPLLPGNPVTYEKGAPVPIFVDSLTSVKTELPYAFYSLPFPRDTTEEDPDDEMDSMNLGDYLGGERRVKGNIKLEMGVNSECLVLGTADTNSVPLSSEQIDNLREMVNDDYYHNWIVDDLPGAERFELISVDTETGEEITEDMFRKGFPLGYVDDKGQPALNNHFRLNIKTHKSKTGEGFRVVGFEVDTQSIRHEWPDMKTKNLGENKPNFCLGKQSEAVPMPQYLDEATLAATGNRVVFTYVVTWENDPDTAWAERWDHYLKTTATDTDVHWFSILSSAMIVLFLSAMVAMILLRIVNKDLKRYNDPDEEDEIEETGWKLVSGHVFRAPKHGTLLSTFAGTGLQLACMAMSTMVFAVLGFLSPAHHGLLATSFLVLYVFMGIVGGYFASRIYATFALTEWKKATLWTAFMFPGVLFCSFFVLDLFLWGKGSSAAIPFLQMFALIVLWFGVSVPLVYLGAYLGNKKGDYEVPCKVNLIPRQIPEQQWYMKANIAVPIGGLLPFGAVFIEIYFILTSIWQNQYYYMFTALFVSAMILLITCAEISIVLTYFQLCAEDYNWWWRAFLTSGSSALYLAAYSVWYFFSVLDVNSFIGGMLYFCYMFGAALSFFLLTGSVGFLSTFLFIRYIYGAIKSD